MSASTGKPTAAASARAEARDAGRASEMILWSVSDLRAFLRGRWHIDRTLVDRRHAVSGTFRGHAEYTPAGRSLRYEERGSLDFGSHHGSAEQRYSYDFDTTDRRAIVRFRDGRIFHEIDLSSGQAVVAHACDPDLYEGRITAIGPMQWTCVWTIAGPRKEQEIRSLYTRVD